MDIIVLGGTVTSVELTSGVERAVTDVVSMMLNYQPMIVPYQSTQIDTALSAIVGFGGKMPGFLALHLGAESACTLASALLGMSFEGIDDIVTDAMGELVNMLAGGLKKNLSQNEELFRISVPSVILGKDYSTHAPIGSQQLLLGVQAGPCLFTVQLVVAPS